MLKYGLQRDVHVLQFCSLSVFVSIDNGKDYDVIYLDFSKVFDRIPVERLSIVAEDGIGGEVLS